MLLGANKDLENEVIKYLSRRGFLSAEDLLGLLKKDEIRVSIQAIYHILRKLQGEGVVVKEGQSYSLRIAWILDMANLSDQMQQTYLQQKYIGRLMPAKVGEKRTGQNLKTWNIT